MKVFYSLIATLLFTGLLSAQSITKHKQISPPMLQNESGLNYSDISKSLFKTSTLDTVNTNWYNYAKLWHDSLFPDDYGAGLRADFLFPDTNIRLQYLQGWVGPQIHGIAVTLDPSAPIFWKHKINTKIKYSIDTILFPCAYFRKLKNPEADTLVVEVATGYVQPVYDIKGGSLKTDYGVDTLKYLDVHFDPATLRLDKKTTNYIYDSLKIPRPKYYLYKYLLTPKDTSIITGQLKLTDVKIPTDSILSSTGNIVINIFFKPGYSYKVKDDLRKMNYLQFFTRAQKGINDYPAYIPGDWNSSYIIHSWFMDPNPNVSMGLYGYFVPPWLFQRPWYYDNHLIDVCLTANSTRGITENKDNSLSLSQNNPNPASNSTIINYELKSVNKVNFKVFDITGGEIININKGTQSIGKHSISINTSKFANGIYFYTLTTDNTQLTRKMIVNK